MEISKIPTELRAKRTREQAGLDDAEAGNARKTAAKTWGLELRDLASATKGYMTRAQCKTDTVEALLALGACSAAAMRVTQTLGDIGTLRDWLFSRKQLTRAALRMWQHTQCPEECKKGENCTWRVAPGELDRTDGPRFVALDDANKAVDGFFPLADLPNEVIGHIVRMVAYDFTTLSKLSAVCRTLRCIVADTLPQILVDCTVLVRAHVPDLAWVAH